MRDGASPIFIVGSPRSGTSIMTWCLGQHPNILPIEESNWMGPLALQLFECHRIGSARNERSHLGSMRITASMLMEAVGESINRLTLAGRARLEERQGGSANQDAAGTSGAFRVSRDPSDPKERWVDGTPEYSFFIWGLRELFPRAKFIHLIRDVHSVVRSMMHFASIGGAELVHGEQAAYEYWLRAVKACVEAERALGSDIVLRIRYKDLVGSADPTLRRCMAFLGEAFCPEIVEPIATKINSSVVSAERPAVGDRASSDVREEAGHLCQELLSGGGAAYSADPVLQLRMKQAFEQRAGYLGRADAALQSALRRAAVAEEELRQLRGWSIIERLRAAVEACTEYNATVAVVSKGDESLMNLGSREAWHFPRDSRGRYSGHHPPESGAAIRHLESLREQGALYLLIPQPSLWWLDYYVQLAEHLDGQYQRVWAHKDTGVLYKLGGR